VHFLAESRNEAELRLHLNGASSILADMRGFRGAGCRINGMLPSKFLESLNITQFELVQTSIMAACVTQIAFHPGLRNKFP
jgi:hypothetical protein